MVSLQAFVVSLALVGGGGGSDVVLLDFTADWCQPCKAMAPAIHRLEEQGFPVRRINIDEQPQVARQFKVQSIPCFVLVENGREIDRVTGASSYDLLVRLFERHGYAPAAETTVRAQSPDDESRSSNQWLPTSGTQKNEASQPIANAAATSDDPRPSVLAASVRIRVEEPNGQAYATGTIIDVHGDEALVVTCGHVFRDTQGRGNITVELLAPGANSSVPGTLIAYDAEDRDIGLLAFKPGTPVSIAPIANGVEGIKPGAAVFSVGCDHGKQPTVINSQIVAVDKYSGRRVYAHNIEVAGQPVDGRSGGGLFDAQGRLIGICNAADPADDEGIYAGLKTIHGQLDQIKLSHIYQRPSAAANALASQTVPAQPESFDQDITAGPETLITAPAGVPNLMAALDADAEVICVVRGRDQKNGQVIVLDRQSRDLLSRYMREQSGAAATIASLPDEPTTIRAQGGRD